MKVTHYSRPNTYYFVHNGKKVLLNPSKPASLRTSKNSSRTTKRTLESSSPSAPKVETTKPLHILNKKNFCREVGTGVVHALVMKEISENLDTRETPSIFRELSMDFVLGLPEAIRKQDSIMVVVNDFIKWYILYPIEKYPMPNCPFVLY